MGDSPDSVARGVNWPKVGAVDLFAPPFFQKPLSSTMRNREGMMQQYLSVNLPDKESLALEAHLTPQSEADDEASLQKTQDAIGHSGPVEGHLPRAIETVERNPTGQSAGESPGSIAEKQRRETSFSQIRRIRVIELHLKSRVSS